VGRSPRGAAEPGRVMNGMEESGPAGPAPQLDALLKKGQHYLDKTVLWHKTRWCCFFGTLVAFAIRVKLSEGYYIVTYALAIYLLNILIGFLSPQEDPETSELTLPQNEEEFRPFTRKLPEFKAWVLAQRAALVSFCMTFCRAFDLPVFWPILLLYFLFLFTLTMKKQVNHMLTHKYVPFSFGKKSYKDLTSTKPVGKMNTK